MLWNIHTTEVALVMDWWANLHLDRDHARPDL